MRRTRVREDAEYQRIEAKGYMADLLTDYTVEFLKTPRTKPFVAYVAHKAIDGPFIPAAPQDVFANETTVRSANVKDNLDGKSALQRNIDRRARLCPRRLSARMAG